MLFSFLGILMGLNTYSQQEPQFTQYMFQNMNFNPGTLGNENAICVTGAYRQQWVGFKDDEGNRIAPETFFVTGGLPIKALHGGIGAAVMQDKIGYEKTILFKLGYAYQKAVGFGKLGIGTMVEFNNRTIDFSKLKAAEEDPLITSLGSSESDMLFDFSLGLYYNVPDAWYIGLSGVHLLNSKGKVLSSSSGYDLRMQLDRTIFLTGGYIITFNRYPNFELVPSALIKTNLSAVQLDLSAMLRYKEKFWGGLGYRYQDAVSVIVGFQIKDIRVGYSYDINTSKLRLPFGGGTHEVMINYCFKLELEKGRKSYKNTRFL